MTVNENDLKVAAEIGALGASIKNVSDAVTMHSAAVSEQLGEARASRTIIYQKLDERANDAAAIKQELEGLKRILVEYEPDLKRCRMFRYWGIISLGLITTGALVVGLMSGLAEWVSLKWQGAPK